MALNDLTDPIAVRSAIEEFDKLGRDDFLAKYGFGEARNYIVLVGDRAYDSKAIAGAAHGFQFGRALKASEFSGGDATVVPVLRRLGFQLVRAPAEAGQSAVTPAEPAGQWSLKPGDVVTRSDVSKAYGGSIYGGIESSTRTKNVMIYTDPTAGEANGYNFDEWDPNEPGVFYYSGEGPSGDQQMTFGNKAILDHVENGNTLRLFEAVDGKKRKGGKLQRYVGGFTIDPAAPWEYKRGPGRDGRMRNVIVFKLHADSYVSEPEGPGTVDVPSDPEAPRPLGPGVVMVPSEKNTVTEFERAPAMGARANRVEAQLVSRWEEHLLGLEHRCLRISIKIPGEAARLVTDTYDETADELFEAKSSADRATIRLGVGQLLDYLRFVPGARGALLLPERPTADLVAFVHSAGFGVVYETPDGWGRLDPASSPV